MQTRVGLALAVMMAMALGHIKEGRLDQIRSLVKPIPPPGRCGCLATRYVSLKK